MITDITNTTSSVGIFLPIGFFSAKHDQRHTMITNTTHTTHTTSSVEFFCPLGFFSSQALSTTFALQVHHEHPTQLRALNTTTHTSSRLLHYGHPNHMGTSYQALKITMALHQGHINHTGTQTTWALPRHSRLSRALQTVTSNS